MTTTAPTSGWSSSTSVTDEYVVTITPGAGGAVVMQYTVDGVTWLPFGNDPIAVTGTFAVPLGAIYLRGQGIGAAGSFDAVQGPAEAGTLTAAQAAVVAAGGLSSGYTTILFGDSETDTYETSASGLTGTYSPTSGVVSIAMTGHQQAVGWYSRVWNRAFTSTLVGQRLPCAVVTDANTLSFNIGANLPGVSASDSNWVVRPESWRSAQNFVTWLQMMSGWKFNIIRNSAQAGDTTANCLARLQSECLAYNPQCVIMLLPGINDTSAGNGNVKASTILANQQSIVQQIVAAGAKLILLNTLPVASGEARGTLTNMQRVQWLNRQMRDYCSNLPGVLFFDANKIVTDQTSSSGLAIATYLRAADKIHQSILGASLLSNSLWTQIRGYFPSDFSTLPDTQIDNYWASALSLTSVSRSGGVVTGTSASHGWQIGETGKLTGGSESFNEFVTITAVSTNTVSFVTASGSDGAITGTINLGRSLNLVPNHMLTTTSGGLVTGTNASGTAAGNIRVEVTAGTPTSVVASVPAAVSGYGNAQQIVVTTGTDSVGLTVNISSDFTTYTTTLPAIVLAGRFYAAEAMLTLTGVNGSLLTEILFNVSAICGGTTYQTYALNGYGAAIETLSAATSDPPTMLHLRTAPMMLPSGSVTRLKWVLQLRFATTGSAGNALTAKLERIRLQESLSYSYANNVSN